jgi:hypothetical protein
VNNNYGEEEEDDEEDYEKKCFRKIEEDSELEEFYEHEL